MTPEAVEREVKSLWSRFQALRNAGHVVIALREPEHQKFTLVGSPRCAAYDEHLLALLNPKTTREYIQVLITGQPIARRRSA